MNQTHGASHKNRNKVKNNTDKAQMILWRDQTFLGKVAHGQYLY